MLNRKTYSGEGEGEGEGETEKPRRGGILIHSDKRDPAPAGFFCLPKGYRINELIR